jgi:hypothetical protein
MRTSFVREATIAQPQSMMCGWLALLSSALVLDGFDFDGIGEHF